MNGWRVKVQLRAFRHSPAHTMAKGRIFAVPVLRHQFAFFYQHPTSTAPLKPLSSSTSLWSRVDTLADRAGAFWQKFGKSPEKSWKLWIFRHGNRMLDKIDKDEWFLKEISHPMMSSTQLVAPPEISQSHMVEILQSISGRHKILHRHYFRLSLACIPLSIVAGILPVFRVYSNYKAYYGATYLSEFLELPSSTLDFISDPLLASTLQTDHASTNESSLQDPPSNANSLDISQPLSSDNQHLRDKDKFLVALDAIVVKYQLPEVFIQNIVRSRNQFHQLNNKSSL